MNEVICVPKLSVTKFKKHEYLSSGLHKQRLNYLIWVGVILVHVAGCRGLSPTAEVMPEKLSRFRRPRRYENFRVRGTATDFEIGWKWKASMRLLSRPGEEEFFPRLAERLRAWVREPISTWGRNEKSLPWSKKGVQFPSSHLTDRATPAPICTETYISWTATQSCTEKW